MSLRKKTILISMVSASVSLFVTCLIFYLSERHALIQDKASDLLSLSKVLNQKIIESINPGKGKPLQHMFDSLGDNPDVLAACFYDPQGKPLILYHPDQNHGGFTPPTSLEWGVTYAKGTLKSVSDVPSDGKSLGTLYLEFEVDEIQLMLKSYLFLAFLIWLLALFVSYLIASRLEKHVSEPLRQVVIRMREIALGEEHLSQRLEVPGKDEIGQVAEAFNAFVGKLQTVAEMKLDLISVVSHQLKTPVAEINGFIENMMDGLTGDLNPRQKIYLEEMRAIGQNNYRLISDLLSASKIDRGIISADLKPVSAGEVVSLAVRDYDKALEKKGLKLILEEPATDIELFADRDNTVEALRNLLNNALKCTDKGTVTIRVYSEGDFGVIEVRDTGIGMDPETLGNLFTQRRVLGKEAHRSGAGLGLYISRSFMRVQQADITVTSEPGQGSCFKLMIPKVRRPKGAAA
jgi:signal transduction histidine kinase